MQHLEVSCAVRPIEWPLGVKWLTMFYTRNTPRTAIHAARCGMAIVITKDPTL